MCIDEGCNIIKYAKIDLNFGVVNVGIPTATESIHVVIESERQSTRSVLVNATVDVDVIIPVSNNGIDNFDSASSYFIIRWFGDNAGDIDTSNQLQIKDNAAVLTDCLVFKRNRKFVECFGAASEFQVDSVFDGVAYSDDDDNFHTYSDGGLRQYSD